MLQLQAAIEAADQRERVQAAAKEAADKEAAAKEAAGKEESAPPPETRLPPTKVDGEGLRVSEEMELDDEIEDPDAGEGEEVKVSRQVKRLNQQAKAAIAAATDAAKSAKKTSATPPRGRQKVG